MAEPLTHTEPMQPPSALASEAPSRAEYVDATCRRYAEGYGHGWSAGYVAAQRDVQDAARQAHAAGIAQEHLQVHQARERAAARWGA